ncbi:MAG: hypothetical protein A3F67_03445 [Verrucomicrobia bacterium RIFCSPHIGHO2_12_FULL_41_10]|nr:MAG: hypothetical protein A3F67_03445 [Verrucomicrobia bacterium RIFCSPHIGHO2_12_FULL_41_10]HLB34864.1 hypothetical protein [Chthoniobacterales bacterium]
MFLFVLLWLFSASLFAQEVRRALPVHATPHEVAQFLAGFPVSGASALSSLQLTKEYLEHHLAIQKAWKECQEQRFEPMKNWASQEMTSRIPAPTIVRYLFGGPDELSLLALFPNASVYILCGKEPVGKIMPPEELSTEQLKMGLSDLRESMKTFLHYGYFITKEMKTTMGVGFFQGVTPILFTFLALTGHQIIAVETVNLGGAPGIRIRFLAPAGGQEQMLYYMQTDLSNEASHSFLKWLGSFGPGAAYLKAASYLLHEENFSRAREFLLNSSNTILEDDSGIPCRFFTPAVWSLYFFGDYKGPIELFRCQYQPDLYAAYAASPLRGPMPFGTGYQLIAGASGGANLLLAVKKSFVPKALPKGEEESSVKKIRGNKIK